MTQFVFRAFFTARRHVVVRPQIQRLVHDHGRVEHLLRPNDVSASALDLEEIDVDLYVAPQKILWAPIGGVGVFGGQVIRFQ